MIATGDAFQGFHSLGIQENGTLWAWGLNDKGQLGDGTTTNRTVPTQIGTDTDWAFVAAGSNSSYAIKQNGTLWAWGDNSQGQLSDGTLIGRLTPAQVLPGTTWSQVDAGDRFVVALKSDGTLWSCGYGVFGQLGRNVSGLNDPNLIQNTPVTGWESISCSNRQTVMRRNDNTIWGFGEGTSGRLATGTGNGLSIPTQLPLLPNPEWQQAITGSANSLFLKNDNTIWVVGQNLGNLGIGLVGLMANQIIQSGTANDWLRLESASTHTMVIKNNGTLWSCGENDNGQLGLGNTIFNSFWSQIGTNTNWAKARCGSQHTLALTNTGTLWAWGLNSSGQLGDGTTTNRNVPVRIGQECILNTTGFEQKLFQLRSNPVREVAFFSFMYDGVKKLTVYNSTGQAVVTTTTRDDVVGIATLSLPQGIYMVVCESELGRDVEKLIIGN